MTTFFCPRRHDQLSFAGYSPIFEPEREGEDTWRVERDPYHLGPSCSYCGSCSPDVLFAAIEAGHEIGPTDKGYKLYLELPNLDPDALRVNASTRASEPPSWGGDSGTTWSSKGTWKRASELTDAERSIAEGGGMLRSDDVDPEHWLLFGSSGPTKHGKFYFQHFSKDDRARFLDLHNAGRIAFGYPGHLYVKPYFARAAG